MFLAPVLFPRFQSIKYEKEDKYNHIIRNDAKWMYH
jgi:hypothetical protein